MSRQTGASGWSTFCAQPSMQMRRDPIDKAAQRASRRRFVRRQAGTQRNASPDRLQLVAPIEPWRAIASERRRCARIEHAIFVRVMEDAAAVVVDERLDKAPSAIMTSCVSSSMWKYSIV